MDCKTKDWFPPSKRGAKHVEKYEMGRNKKGFQFAETLSCFEWELTGSNRRPSACKADALNQLS